MIKIQGLTHAFGDHVVLENVEMEAPEATIMGLVGINGAGKSTLLRLMSGVYIPQQGTITYDGKSPMEAQTRKDIFLLPDDPFFTNNTNCEGLFELYKNFYPDADENVMGTVNILEAARKSGVRRVVFASTAAVYGDVAQSRLPLVEETPLLPLSFYGFTKMAAEHYLGLYQRNYGLSYVVLRFANVYGERQGDTGEGGVISIFAKRIAKDKGITIFGDGEQTRDFVYAGDVAAGVLAALKTENVNTEYNIYWWS